MNLCPRCHQPLEDDEEYVCCADATKTWQCTACHKIWEGFAFPCGMCPSCGGALSREIEVHDPADASETVRFALEIELGGVAFYCQCQDLTPDPGLRRLFGSLARMEAEHAALLTCRYHVSTSASEREEPTIPQIAVYAGADTVRVTDDISLLALALTLEERARDFFRDQAAVHPRGSSAWRLVQELAAEEEEHVQLISGELSLRRQGRSGLLV